MNKSLTVAVLGYEGYIGKKTVDFLLQHPLVQRVVGVDLTGSNLDIGGGTQTYAPHGADDVWGVIDRSAGPADMTFVCLPTNSREDGGLDDDLVGKAITFLQTNPVIICSTLPIGLARSIEEKAAQFPGADIYANVAVVPHFIGESKYYIPEDEYFHPTEIRRSKFIIVGATNPRLRRKVIDFYAAAVSPSCHLVGTTPLNATLAKLFSNASAAVKVTMANQFADICAKAGADYGEVLELWGLNPLNSKMHMRAFKADRGAGGKCLPKDTMEVLTWGERNGNRVGLLEMVAALNKKLYRTHKGEANEWRYYNEL